MSHSFTTLLVETKGPHVQVVINRPDALNALNETVLRELKQLFTEVLQFPAHRVVTLEGAGGKAFVAGADISAMQQMTSIQAEGFARLGQEVTELMEHSPFLVIGKVRGFALGGGCELAMACDILVASKNAKFGQPEVNLGLIPGFGGTQRLARRVGLPLALDLLCAGRGRMLSGDEAYAAGLVSRVVADEQLDSECQKVVEATLKAAPHAVARTKQLARASFEMGLATGLASEATAFGGCFAGEEAKIGIRAFLEKTTPEWPKH